jgi:hypothetical protein
MTEPLCVADNSVPGGYFLSLPASLTLILLISGSLLRVLPSALRCILTCCRRRLPWLVFLPCPALPPSPVVVVLAEGVAS